MWRTWNAENSNDIYIKSGFILNLTYNLAFRGWEMCLSISVYSDSLLNLVLWPHLVENNMSRNTLLLVGYISSVKH